MGKQMVRLVGKRNLVSKQIFRSGFALCYANATRTTCSSPAAPLLFHVSLNLNTITSVVWIFTECIFNKNKLASNCLEKFFFWTLTFEDLILQQVDVFLYHLTRRTIFVFLFSFYFVVFHSRSGHVESIFEAKAGWGISSAPAFQGIPCRCLPFIFS